MDEMEFTEAESNMNDLVSEYQQVFDQWLLRCALFAKYVFSTKRRRLRKENSKAERKRPMQKPSSVTVR